MMATRISRLEANKFQPTPEADAHAHFAEYGMYPDGSRLQCRHEHITMAQELAWILEVSDSDNGADIITHAINEWCGGGFAGKPKEEAIAGWVALGLTLVAAFSLGLAATLSAIGLSLVFGRGFVERHWGRSLELLPVLGAAAMVLLGLALAFRGLLA